MATHHKSRDTHCTTKDELHNNQLLLKHLSISTSFVSYTFAVNKISRALWNRFLHVNITL